MKKGSRFTRVAFIAGTALLALSFPATADSSAPFRLASVNAADFGILTGNVVDAGSGVPLSAALVAVKGTSLRQSTDADGFFLIERVPLGGVVLEVSRPGYKSRELSVSVAPGDPTRWTIALARLKGR